MTALRATDLVAKRNNVPLFEPVTLGVEAGTYLEITGANGSGKTTLLRTLAGLYEQYDGEFEIASAMYSGHRLGLDPLLTALENLSWLGQLSDTQLATKDMVEALQAVEMMSLAMQTVGQMSQGQQRRVMMAHWQLSNAPVWLLDEPLNALDVNGRALVAQLVRNKITNGGIVVCATHLPIDLQLPTEVEGADESWAGQEAEPEPEPKPKPEPELGAAVDSPPLTPASSTTQLQTLHLNAVGGR